MSEDYEVIMRRMRELEERIKERETTIKEVQYHLERIRELLPYMTHEELLRTHEEYRHLWYSLRSLRGWQTRDIEELEELSKMIPPYKFERIRLTFSIETGVGHEPFLAEMTCNTMIPREMDEDEVIERVCNAAVKYFWILFDAWKDVTKDMEVIWGRDEYSRIVKRIIFFQKYAKEVYEEGMDELLTDLIRHGGLYRPPEEYVTTEAILNIGVETPTPAPETAEPKYPKFEMFIDKKIKYELQKTVTIRLAEKTRINMLEMLGIMLEVSK